MAPRPQLLQKSPAAPASRARQLILHGIPVELDCRVEALDPTLGRAFSFFEAGVRPQGPSPVRGAILPYESAEIARRLPPQAKPLHRSGELLEIYTHQEHTWLIDERWGMCEINLLRGQWRSWILPQATFDPVKLVDPAVYWPLTQLLKNKGIDLVPAVSVVNDGFGVLILSPFGLEAELAVLLGRRYRVIGQRWTALREENGRTALLHMPGLVQKRIETDLRSSSHWVDLTAYNANLAEHRAWCNAVLMIDAGRRHRASVRAWSAEDGATVTRLSWPLPDLHPNRRHAPLASRLAAACRCYQLQLSRNPNDLYSLLESIRAATPLRRAA